MKMNLTKIECLFILCVFMLLGCSDTNYRNNDTAVSNPFSTKAILDLTGTGMSLFKDVKALVDKGADTENILLPHLSYNNDTDCHSVLYVLKKNKRLYKNRKTLNTKPNNPFVNEVDKYYRREDLAILADTGDGKTVCNEAIKLLVKINPALKNTQIKYDGSTSIHQYLKDTHHPDWKLSIAKLLIDQKNINTRRFGDGYTPVHVLLLENRHHDIRIEKELITEMVRKGADLKIKSNHYYSNGKKPGIDSISLIKKKYPNLLKH